MKLYYSPGACSLAVRIIINELRLKCEYEPVDLKSHKTQSGKDFYQINPKGYVPALQVEDQVLSENLAIQIYLAEKHPDAGLLPQLGDFTRYRVLEWLAYISTELHKSFGPLFNPNIDQTLKNDLFIPAIQKKFAFVDEKMGDNNFLMDDKFTLPDGYFFVMLLWAEKMLPEGIKKYKNLTRYFTKMKEHPSVQKSLKEEFPK